MESVVPYLDTAFWLEEIFESGKDSGCGTLGRAIASYTRDLRFESQHPQKFISQFYTIEKTKIKIKKAGIGPLKRFELRAAGWRVHWLPLSLCANTKCLGKASWSVKQLFKLRSKPNLFFVLLLLFSRARLSLPPRFLIRDLIHFGSGAAGVEENLEEKVRKGWLVKSSICQLIAQMICQTIWKRIRRFVFWTICIPAR